MYFVATERIQRPDHSPHQDPPTATTAPRHVEDEEDARDLVRLNNQVNGFIRALLDSKRREVHDVHVDDARDLIRLNNDVNGLIRDLRESKRPEVQDAGCPRTKSAAPSQPTPGQKPRVRDEAYWKETGDLVCEYIALQIGVEDVEHFEPYRQGFVDWLMGSPDAVRRYENGDDMARAALVDSYLGLVR